MNWLCIALLMGLQQENGGTRQPVPQAGSFVPQGARPVTAPASGGVGLRIYDVRDLALSMGADFEPPQLGLGLAPAPLFDPRDARPTPGLDPAHSGEERIQRGMATLVDLIAAHIQPPLEAGDEALRAMPDGSTLVASLTPERHAWLDAFLRADRDFHGFVRVQARFLEAPRGVLAEWKLAPSATLATPAELEALLARIERDGRFTSTHAPALLTLPNQRANVAVVEETAYVADWTVRVVEPGHKEIADPEVALVRSGLVLDLRASPLPDGFLGLVLAFEQVELKRLPTATLRIGASREQEVEVALPETMTVRFSTTLSLAQGASAVLVTPHTDGEHDVALIVTAERIEKPMEPASPK